MHGLPPMNPVPLASSAALQGFLDAAPDALVVVNQSGTIVLANASTERLFGYTLQERVGKPIELLVPDRLHEAHAGYRNHYLQDPQRHSMGVGRELSGRRKDGSEFSVEISLAPLETEAGKLVISIIRDTTLRRQAEAKFRRLLESAPDGIIVVDREGRIVIVNQKAEQLFDYSRDELLGKPIEVLIPDRLEALHEEHRASFFATPEARPVGVAGVVLTGRRRDGSEFPMEISFSPMQSEQGVLVSAAIRDISERQRMEDQLRASLREKEILLKEVHHRVKNNLQVVSSMLNMQMHLVKDPSALELFKESQSRVRSIALFHEKLYQSTDLARADVSEYLKAVITGVFATYGVTQERIQLSFRVEQLPLSIDAAISCGLIVNELVSNALKHAFPPGRTGTVSIHLRADGPRHAILEVSNDGVEFPSDVSLDSPKTLGLKLVSIFTEQLRGTLHMHRSHSTRFVIRFERGWQRA